MKKLLSITACAALATNSMAVVGCSFDSNKATYTNHLIEEYVKVAGYAARPGILSTENGLDPGYVFQHYGNMKVKDLMPDYFGDWEKNGQYSANTTLSDVIGGLFNDNTDSNFTNKGIGNSGISFKGTKSPEDASLSSTFSMLRAVLAILSSKLDPYSAQQLENILASPNFASILKSITALKAYSNSGFLTGIGNALTSVKGNKAKPSEYTNQTYEQVMQSAKIVLANFLNSLRKTPAPYLDDSKDDIGNNVKNLEAADTLFQNSIIDIITGNTASDMKSALLSAEGIPNLIKFVMLLVSYIEAFNHGPNSSLALNNQTADYDANHLFNPTETNFQVKQTVLAEKFTSQNISLQEGARLLQLFLGVDPVKDGNGFNMLKLLNILFDNKATYSMSTGEDLQDLEISYSAGGETNVLPQTLGFDQIWLNVIDGAIKGLIHKFVSSKALVDTLLFSLVGNKVASFIYKPVYDIANNASNLDNFLQAFIGQAGPVDQKDKWFDDKGGLLGLIATQLNNFLVKSFITPAIRAELTVARTYLLKFQKDFTGSQSPLYNKNGVFVSLYSGNGVANTMKWINTIIPNTIAPDTIKNLADIKTVETEPVSSLLSLFHVTLPNYLYIMQENSLNDVVNAFASQLGVKDRYQKTQYTASQIDVDTLGKMFLALGKTASDSIKASGEAIISRIAGVDATKVSTLSYAITLMSTPSTDPTAGLPAAFKILGLRPANEESPNPAYWNNSALDNIGALYGQGNMTGLHDTFVLIGAIISSIEKGMTDNEKANYLKYFNESQWNVPLNAIRTKITNNNRVTTFDEYYTNPDNNVTKEYEIEMYINLIQPGSFYQWSSWKLIPNDIN